MRWSWILVAAMTLSPAACGKDDKGGEDDEKKNHDPAESGGTDETNEAASSSGGPVGACDRRENEKVCAEYWGDGATREWVKEQCDYQKVAMLDKCPTEGAVGRCVRNEGTPSEIQNVWYEGAEAMLDACEKSGGTRRDP